MALNTVQYADIARYAVLPEQTEVYSPKFGCDPAREFDYVIRYKYRDLDCAEIAHKPNGNYLLFLQGDETESPDLPTLEDVLISWILEEY